MVDPSGWSPRPNRVVPFPTSWKDDFHSQLPQGWRPVEGDFTDAVAQLGTPMATKDCGTLKSAKSWAAETVDDAEESSFCDVRDGVFLSFLFFNLCGDIVDLQVSILRNRVFEPLYWMFCLGRLYTRTHTCGLLVWLSAGMGRPTTFWPRTFAGHNLLP